MASHLRYDTGTYLPERAFQLFRIGTSHENGYKYEKGFGEKVSYGMLWHVEKLPKKILPFIKDPRVVTIALSALAMVATSFTFYPFITLEYAKLAIATMPLPPLWTVKLSAYIATIWTILGYTVRAESRFMNTELTDQLYKK